MKFFAALLLTLLLILPAQAYAPGCDRMDTFAAAFGAELVPWIGYPKGWELPADLQVETMTDFADDGGVWVQYSPSTGERFVWHFVSYAISDDSGAHQFCGPYKVQP